MKVVKMGLLELKDEWKRQVKIAAAGKVEMSIWTPHEQPIADWDGLVETLVGKDGDKREWYTDEFRDCIYRLVKRTEVGKEKARLKRIRLPAEDADLDLTVGINWTGDFCESETFPIAVKER